MQFIVLPAHNQYHSKKKTNPKFSLHLQHVTINLRQLDISSNSKY